MVAPRQSPQEEEDGRPPSPARGPHTPHRDHPGAGGAPALDVREWPAHSRFGEVPRPSTAAIRSTSRLRSASTIGAVDFEEEGGISPSIASLAHDEHARASGQVSPVPGLINSAKAPAERHRDGGAPPMSPAELSDVEQDVSDGWCAAALGTRLGEPAGAAACGFLTGFLGAMGGVGGGPFCVPLLGALLGLSQRRCIGTSILCGLTTLTVGGATTFFSSGGRQLQIPLLPIGIIATVAPIFGYMSARKAARLSQATLKQVFAVFLLLCSLQILYRLAYSPTGVEGHWEYDLPGRGGRERKGLVYEIEGVDGGFVFRTQHFHAVLEPAAVFAARPVRARGQDRGGMSPPVGFEQGWTGRLMNVRNTQQRGTIWVRVLNRGTTLETAFHSRVPQPHWNARVVAGRKRGVVTRVMSDIVGNVGGSVAFHTLLAVVAGTASGLLGIAGGSVVVPLMSLTGAFPWPSITATSLLSMIPTSAVTCFTHHRAGNVVLRHAPGLVVGTVTGAFAGARLMTVTTEVVRKSACAGVLLFTAVIMMYQGWRKSFAGRDRRALFQLSAGTIMSFAIAALLQEKVFNLPEFSHEYLLTFLQSTIIGGLAFIDLHREGQLRDGRGSAVSPTRTTAGGRSLCAAHAMEPPRCPVAVYVAVALLGSTSALLTNKASHRLNYTTQVVFKSSKLPWIMLWRMLFLQHKRRPTVAEWACAAVLSCGLAAFTFAGTSGVSALSSQRFSWGIVCILGALACDATVYTVEEGLVFGRYKADKHELIFYMQAFSIPTTFCYLVLSGDVTRSFDYIQSEWRFPTLILGSAACMYMGTRCLMQIIQEYDSNLAVTVTLLRKCVTVLVSYAFFPKAFKALHIFGLAMVVVGAYGQLRASRRWTDDGGAASTLQLSGLQGPAPADGNGGRWRTAAEGAAADAAADGELQCHYETGRALVMHNSPLHNVVVPSQSPPPPAPNGIGKSRS